MHPFDRKIMTILKQSMKKATPHVLMREWIKSTLKWSWWNYSHSSQWVSWLDGALKSKDPPLDRYFVLIGGIINDLSPYFDQQLNRLEPLIDKQKGFEDEIKRLFLGDQSVVDHFLIINECNILIKQFSKHIKDSEKSAISYLRNKYSHPRLNKYKVQIILDNNQEFIFDAVDYVKSKKHEGLDEAELFNTTKARILSTPTLLKELEDKLLELRF